MKEGEKLWVVDHKNSLEIILLNLILQGGRWG